MQEETEKIKEDDKTAYVDPHVMDLMKVKDTDPRMVNPCPPAMMMHAGTHVMNNSFSENGAINPASCLSEHDIIICPACGAKNQKQAKFCIECGAKGWNSTLNSDN